MNKMEEALQEYYNAFNKVLSLIRDLPRWRKSCECEEVEEPFFVDDIGEGLVSKYCTTCGGHVET